MLNFQINSKLVWDCHKSLVILEKQNRIQMMWVPGHMGIDENKMADQLARQGSSCPLTGLGQIGNMRSTGSPFMDKNKLQAFLKDPLLKKPENYST